MRAGGLLLAGGVLLLAAPSGAAAPATGNVSYPDGWYGATYSAGEIRDPGRNLPRGLIAGTLAVTLLYVAVNVVYAWALTPAEMAQSARVGEANQRSDRTATHCF